MFYKMGGILKLTKLSKYSPLIFLLIPLIFIPLDWYQHLIAVTYKYLNVTGIFILFEKHGSIAIIYLLCIMIQIMSIKSEQFLFPAVAEIILILVLTFYPSNYFPIKFGGLYFLSTLYIGYFIAVISIMVSIVLNVIKTVHVNSYNKS